MNLDKLTTEELLLLREEKKRTVSILKNSQHALKILN